MIRRLRRRLLVTVGRWLHARARRRALVADTLAGRLLWSWSVPANVRRVVFLPLSFQAPPPWAWACFGRLSESGESRSWTPCQPPPKGSGLVTFPCLDTVGFVDEPTGRAILRKLRRHERRERS